MRIGPVSAVVLGVVLVAGCAQQPITPPTETPFSPVVTTTTPVYVPATSEFTVAVQILSKQCFGSAGCNLTYRVQPSYTGAIPLNPAQRYTVTYQVSGVQDGPQINSFTIQGTQAQVTTEELAQTASSSAQLTAQVTNVLAN